jgi:hypothetical protein
MGQEMDIAPRTMSPIIKQDVGPSNDKQYNTLPLHQKKIEKIKTPVVVQ